MFGIGKKQEELERELLSKQAEADKYLKKLSEVTNKMRLVQKETETGIASMEESQNELDSQMEKLTQAVKGAAGEAKRQNVRNRELQKKIVILANKAGLADGTYQRSIEGIYRREKELLEMIEQGRKLTSPEEVLELAATGMRQEMGEMGKRIGEMEEMEKQMGILALNAAIEAGRLGEDGVQFVEAAEKVRDLSGKYHQSAAFMAEKMQKMEERLKEAETQVLYLTQIWNEHNARLEKAAEGFGSYASRLEETETRNLVPQILALAESLDQSVGDGELITKQYDAASQVVEQTGKTFMGQQETLNNLRRKAKEVEEWLRAVGAEISK
ncbi:hypothetical protein E5329_02235 [Petralouisia muris]|jgi:methyl-accepting chemotaxis protein|uniref:Uncharacterized protein n=1 Tax=Petralouisia muris TaxID=3032872 RepID=A0AC61S205_9FIRM|nr:methyl-accepting chemotaxis protein [Petralouisia muris]TGY97959.1 hypothetical protein E5329_02235 [Petralouisia muris]